MLLVHGGAREDGLGRHLVRRARASLEGLGVELREHDLLADAFDPVLRLSPDEPHALPCDPASDPLTARYQEDVRWAQALVVLHPVWWFAPPAVVKGWVDRVLVHDVALEQREQGPPRGLCAGKRMLVAMTFNTGAAIDRVAFRGHTTFFWRRVVGLSLGLDSVSCLRLYEVRGLEPTRLKRFEGRLGRALSGLVRSLRP